AVAVVHVAVRIDGHAEVDLVVVEIRRVAAQVPVDARRAEVRAGLPERDRVGAGELADADRPLEPDLVLLEHAAVVVERVRHPLDELAGLRVEAGRDVLSETADLEVAGMHPLATDELDEIENLLALAQAVPEHR